MLKTAIVVAAAVAYLQRGQLFAALGLSQGSVPKTAPCAVSHGPRAQVSVDAFAPAPRSLTAPRADVRRQVFQQDPDQK